MPISPPLGNRKAKLPHRLQAELDYKDRIAAAEVFNRQDPRLFAVDQLIQRKMPRLLSHGLNQRAIRAETVLAVARKMSVTREQKESARGNKLEEYFEKQRRILKQKEEEQNREKRQKAKEENDFLFRYLEGEDHQFDSYVDPHTQEFDLGRYRKN